MRRTGGNVNHEKQSKKAAALSRQKEEILEKEIWPALKNAGVPGWFWPKKVGDAVRGEWSLVKVLEVQKNTETPMWHVTYLVSNPFTGQQNNYTVRYSSGAVAVVLINGKDLLLTNQHRFPLGIWQKEFPQSFTENPGPGDEQFEELKKKKLEWLIAAADKVSVENIGSFYDDPGTRSTKTQVYYVEVEIGEEAYEQALLAKNGRIKQTGRMPFQFHRFTKDAVQERIDQGAFSSLILLGAWYLALRRGKINFIA